MKKILFVFIFAIIILFFFIIINVNGVYITDLDGNDIDLPLPVDCPFPFIIFQYHPDRCFYLTFPGDGYENEDSSFGVVGKSNNMLTFSFEDISNSVSMSNYKYIGDSNWQINMVNAPSLSLNFATILYTSETIYYDDGTIYREADFDSSSLTVDYDLYNGYYRLYTNYFLDDTSSSDIYWNCYLWTGIGDYVDFDIDIPVNVQDWITMDVTSIIEDDVYYFRYECTVSQATTYTICFFNSESLKVVYRTITIDETDILNLHLSTTEQTTDSVYVLSNCYYYDGDYDTNDNFLNNYNIDVAFGLESNYDYSMYIVSGYDEEKQMSYKQYQFEIVLNGVYIFKIENIITEEITYKTFNVSNIGISNEWGEDVYYDNYNDDGEFDPSPILFLEYLDTNTVRIRTQPFTFNELIYLECYFSSDGETYNEITNIYNYSISITTGHSTGGWSGGGRTDDGHSTGGWSGGGRLEGETSDNLSNDTLDVYYFYQDVISSGTYYFKFYNITLDKYTTASIEVDINQFISDNIDKIDNFTDKMVAWSKLHFRIFNLSI